MNHGVEKASLNKLCNNIICTKQVDIAAAFWTCSREVLGSNLGRETGYSVIFRGFSQSLQTDAGTISPLRLGHDFFLTNPLQLSFINYRTNRGVGVRVPVGSEFSLPHIVQTVLGPTQPPIQWVPGAKRQGREADHSPPASAEVTKMWIYTSTPPYAFMA
jgi:hypothetical protein